MRKLGWVVVSAVVLGACSSSDLVAPTRLGPTGRRLDAAPLASTAPKTGAIYTSEYSGVGTTCTGVNKNIYASKSDVYVDGGPQGGGSGLPDGNYAIKVTNPSGSVVLGTSTGIGSTNERPIHVTNGKFDDCYQLEAIVVKGSDQAPGYDDTDNNGGEYKVWVSNGSDFIVAKTDNFKVIDDDCEVDCGAGEADALTVSKSAAGTNDRKYGWIIAKDVDKTVVKQFGGTATFNYTVTVSHDGGIVSNVHVAGTITVTNPNGAAVTVLGVADELSNGVVCPVADGGAGTVPANGTRDFTYSCDLAALPVAPLTNNATLTWGTQNVGANILIAGEANFGVENIAFTETAKDGSVVVTDVFNLTPPPVTIGTVNLASANPASLTYSQTISIPAFGCLSYPNTATFTTNTTGTTGSSSKTVTVCGPARTGALTMGFWQNKNGQAIITGGAALAGVCKSGTWLRAYAPFTDLSATATCAQVGTYVTNVVKAADASGAAMNAMLKAQMLSTALDVYFSDPALGTNKIAAPAPVGGVAIDLTKVCKNILAGCTIYENVGGAFGGATSKTVSQMLTYAASQFVSAASWYGQVKATQELAKDAFDAINNQVAFAAGP